MAKSDFAKMVDDVVRDELMTRGMSYEELVDDVVDNASGDGCTIRLLGEEEDIIIVDQGEHVSRSAVAAQVSRKLKATFSGADPFQAPPEL